MLIDLGIKKLITFAGNYYTFYIYPIIDIMDVHIKRFEMPDGKVIELETGKLARQADGSVILKVGNTMILATVCSKSEISPDIDFFPLSVEYQEKFASAGKIPGSFFKREMRASEYEILICRLVDRALRPMFPEDYRADTQVMLYLISSEEGVLPDAYCGLAASAAIMASNIPFNGPISEVRVARVGGKFIINPTRTELESADLDIIVAGSTTSIVMVEGEMKEVSEEDMLAAIKVAHEGIIVQCEAQIAFAAEIKKSLSKREYTTPAQDEDLRKQVTAATHEAMVEIAKRGIANKQERKKLFKEVKENFLATLSDEVKEEKKKLLKTYLEDTEYYAVREAILKHRIRLDGRGLEEVRPIWCEVDYLPTTHGSALFTRGETQSLTTVTLGTKLDEQMIDGAVFEGYSKLMLNYNFPGFSTGEVKPVRGLSRREVGHGNLALRAIKPMVPQAPENPYTIRIVSDILESNGSSSMATVCAATLALLDAGVQVKKPVSGIAMGLITDESGDFAVLSDILGDEDHLGDMDFKVAGTRDGITACQMDIKVQGLSFEILLKALAQAKNGRLHILGEMNKALDAPRSDYKGHAPRFEQIIIPRELIGSVIGPGGKIIQEIQRESGATIVLTEVDNNGVVDIFAKTKEAVDMAMGRVKGIIAQPEVGEVYTGKIKSILDFGAFVEFMPGKEGLLHISEIDWNRVEKVQDVLTEGEMIEVKLVEVDKKTNKFKLSRKVLLPKPVKQ